MTAKECRTVFNAMMAKLAETCPDPSKADPRMLHTTIQMYQLQAAWEIAAQLAEINEHLMHLAHPLRKVQ
jgi:hypothetical protein